MIKLLACCCFLLGAYGFGICKVKEYKKHYQELVYIRYIINTMLIEVENHRETFGETCLAVSKKVKEPYVDMFLGLYTLLEKERQQSPICYWEEKIGELAESLLLKKEEIEILRGIIRCADCTTISMPLEVLRQSMVEWDKAILQAECIKNERSKVTLCLSLTAGLILCITIL